MSQTIQIQADWAQTDSTQIDFIKNKPNLYEEWWGTQAEYDAILVKDPDKIYNIKTVYYAVSISAGSNGSVTVNGVTGNYTATVPSGSTLTIEGTADSGYEFDEWSDGVSTNPRTITITGNTTLSASFEASIVYYNVSISAGSNGSVTVNGVSGDFSDDVARGTVLTVQGTGNNGYMFDEWSDGNTDNPRTITVSGDITLSAAFEAIPNYFYVEDISGSDNTLSITKSNANAPTVEVFYSTDGTNWTSMGQTDTTPITATIPANKKLYLKVTTNAWSNPNLYYNIINASERHNVGGNTMSLLYGDNFENQTTLINSYTFKGLFNGNNKLENAENLILPATNTTRECYFNMFNNCTNLVTAPALQATTLAQECYRQMFKGCTSLTTAPALPATSLARYCYYNMFSGCTSLTTAPTLPANTLATNCYRGMFSGCTSLTAAPALQATTLAQECYREMFSGCSSLNSVTTYAQDISATNCLNNWLNGVSATGEFYNLGSASYPSGASGIPTGWTEHKPLNYFYVEDASGSDNTLSIKKSSNNAPTIEVFKSTDGTNWSSMGNTDTTAITATVPANGKLYLKCTATKWGSDDSVYNAITTSGIYNVGGNTMSLLYGDNFENQTSFPANSAWCLSSLFRNSTNLTSAVNLQLPATTLVERCYQWMFDGCTALTTPPTDLPATTLTSTCYAHMFSNCTSLTTAPALPATTLADNCYNVMFYGCTALTTAPILPATTLAEGCYFEMFKDCSSLNSVTTYAQDISASNCLTNWLVNVAASGTFYNLGGATYTSGGSGIPTGWTEHNSL